MIKKKIRYIDKEILVCNYKTMKTYEDIKTNKLIFKITMCTKPHIEINDYFYEYFGISKENITKCEYFDINNQTMNIINMSKFLDKEITKFLREVYR